MSNWALRLFCLWLFLGSGAIVRAVNSATIFGTVKDSSDAFLPGVTITARNLETNYSRSVVSSDTGNYRIAALPIGTYELTAELEGFQRLIRSGIKLDVDELARVDLILQVGSIAESVNVVSDAPLLDTQTAAIGQLMDNKKIVDLPLNGRSFIQLATLGTGVAATGGGGASPGNPEGGPLGFSANGQRSTSNYFLLDGTDNNNLYFGFMNVLPSIDAIQEFSIVTNNYSAEFGSKGGAVVNLVTRSGTNSFHGTAFEFIRNSVLDAKNFFDRPDLPIPPFKLNQFGFSLGGPIRKDHTFFFYPRPGYGHYPWLWYRSGDPQSGVHPHLYSHPGFARPQ